MRNLMLILTLTCFLGACSIAEPSSLYLETSLPHLTHIVKEDLDYTPHISEEKSGGKQFQTVKEQKEAKAILVNNRASRIMAEVPELTPELKEALKTQRSLLRRQSPKKSFNINGISYNRNDFIQVIDDLLSGKFHQESLQAVPVANKAEVKFTGYYSPEITVSRKKTKAYKYPILAYPSDFEGKLPSRSEIEKGDVLDFDTYALAWSKDPVDVYNLQLQGSGFVRFLDGERKYFAYGGTNKYPYSSLEQGLKKLDPSLANVNLHGVRAWIKQEPNVRDTITALNPNYGFFRLSEGKARGAAGVELSAGVSVAADPDHYPLGAVLIAKVPVPKSGGKYKTSLLLVQDTGGAIRGSKHLDLYTGVGKKALKQAEMLHDYGQVYLISPR